MKAQKKNLMKNLALIILIGIIFTFTGCGGSSPENTITDYFTAAQQVDVEKMSAMIVPSNKEAINNTKALSKAATEDPYYEYIQTATKEKPVKTTWKIVESKIEGDKATVKVECNYVDMTETVSPVLLEVLSTLLEFNMNGVEVTEYEKNKIFIDAFEKQIEAMKENYETATLEIECIKQDKLWYIGEIDKNTFEVVMKGLASSNGTEIQEVVTTKVEASDKVEEKAIAKETNETNEPTENIMSAVAGIKEKFRNINIATIRELVDKGASTSKKYITEATSSITAML